MTKQTIRKPSSKMRKTVSIITKINNLQPKSKSFEDYSEFISTHIHLLDDFDFRTIHKPSDKMLSAITHIQKEKSLTFIGDNMKDASDFLSQHYTPKET